MSTIPEKTILITGGAGFIGSHLVRLFVNKYPQYRIVNLDALTYAGNLENLKDVETAPNYQFEKGDITDEQRAWPPCSRNIVSTPSFTWPPKAMWIAPSSIRWPLSAPMCSGRPAC